MVEVRSIHTAVPAAVTAASSPATAPASSPARAPLYVQAGAFADPANADRLVARLHDGGYRTIFVRDDVLAGRKMYRVRIGPVADVLEFDRVIAALEHAGVHDAHVALE